MSPRLAVCTITAMVLLACSAVEETPGGAKSVDNACVFGQTMEDFSSRTGFSVEQVETIDRDTDLSASHVTLRQLEKVFRTLWAESEGIQFGFARIPDSVELHDVLEASTGRRFTLYEFRAEEADRAFFFEAGTLNIVAMALNQMVEQCTALEGVQETPECIFGKNTDEGSPHIVALDSDPGNVILRRDSELTDLQIAQLFYGTGALSLDAAFDTFSEGEVTVSVLQEVATGARYTNYSYSVREGESSGSFAFHEGKSEVVSRAEDRFITRCTVFAGVVPCRFGETLGSLYLSNEFTREERTVREWYRLTALEEEQVRGLFANVSGIDPTEDAHDLIGRLAGGVLDIVALSDTRDGAQYELFGGFDGASNSRIGVIYRQGTTDIVARVGVREKFEECSVH